MCAVKNVSATGRTVVCTIHQPSIDIFEAFDEVVLMKRGGRLIYSGLLGQQSSAVISYFERIQGVRKMHQKRITQLRGCLKSHQRLWNCNLVWLLQNFTKIHLCTS